MADNMMGWKIREAREQIGPGSIMMDDWELKKLLGKGSFGDVWLAEKDMVGIADQSAIKIVRIPHDPEEIDAMRAEGFSDDSIRTELHRNVENAVREIRTMLDLQNHPAIVPYKSFDVIQYEEDETWEIDIRMQLLTSLPDWIKANEITPEDVIRMGVSLTDLLAVCEKKNILHRDIKPANIFVDKLNNFKLGDFGLARVVSGSSSAHSKGVGTEAFMAPEVFNGGQYDHRADIYSLGLVMYWLLNHQSLPFTSKGISRSGAISLRLSGEPLPALSDVDPALDRIVRKACDPNPNKRWKTAQEFHDALLNTTVAASSKPEKKIWRTILSVPIVIAVCLFGCGLAEIDIGPGLFFAFTSVLLFVILEKTGVTYLIPSWHVKKQEKTRRLFWTFTIYFIALHLLDSLSCGWMITLDRYAGGLNELIAFAFLGMFPLLTIIFGKRGKRRLALLCSIAGFLCAFFSLILFYIRQTVVGLLWTGYPLVLLILLLAVIFGRRAWMSRVCFGIGIATVVLFVLAESYVFGSDFYSFCRDIPNPYMPPLIETLFYSSELQVLPISRIALFLAVVFGMNLLPSDAIRSKRRISS